ncbi:MAG: hypothetical protein WCP65_00600 [Bacteroidota bacterium]
MITKAILSSFLVLTLVSCNHSPKIDAPKEETPKALENKKASYEIISKRVADDLVESLYNELVNKSVDLKNLEVKIDELQKSKSDSIISFNNYNDKNELYISSANRHCEEIKDSSLRDKMRNLIAKNLTKYNSSIARHTELLKIIETKELTIADLHNILKIVKTLPLIDKYQRDNLPSTNSLEGYIKRQDQTIRDADKLSN